jgi:hypothetical protein
VSTPLLGSPVPGVHVAGRHERLEWRLQRAGWICWGLVLGAALLGLLGSGPLNQRSSASKAGTLQCTHDRIVHHHHLVLLKLRARPRASEFRLRLPDDWLNSVTVKDISPEPIKMTTDRDGAIWSFSSTGDGRHTVRVLVEYEKFGEHEAVFACDSDELLMRQFVLP